MIKPEIIPLSNAHFSCLNFEAKKTCNDWELAFSATYYV
jgi:hypothetical protein